MKKEFLILLIVTMIINSSFSMETQEATKLSPRRHHSDTTTSRKTIDAIESLKKSNDDGDIAAYNKFEQMINNPEKYVSDLKLKRILDALGLIDSDGKVNEKTRKAFIDFKNN